MEVCKGELRVCPGDYGGYDWKVVWIKGQKVLHAKQRTSGDFQAGTRT